MIFPFSEILTSEKDAKDELANNGEADNAPVPKARLEIKDLLFILV
jgi:hypothetical protein